MTNKRFLVLVSAAVIFIIIGFVFFFIDLNLLGIKKDNSEYVSAFFSLSGVLFFVSALLYQIKEYKLQVEELKKSVEAQTKSSEALDEQKKILLEQNVNSIIFGMIDNFNLFKERNQSQKVINDWYNSLDPLLLIRWRELSYRHKLNDSEFNIQFAKDIKELVTKSLLNRDYYNTLRKYVQFAYNILYLIDVNLSNITRDIFTPFFLNQLNSREITLIYFTNLVDHGMPIYTNLKWDYYTTVEIMDILNSQSVPEDFKKIDCNILVNEFNNLRQQ
jgi:hypothetical protein